MPTRFSCIFLYTFKNFLLFFILSVKNVFFFHLYQQNSLLFFKLFLQKIILFFSSLPSKFSSIFLSLPLNFSSILHLYLLFFFYFSISTFYFPSTFPFQSFIICLLLSIFYLFFFILTASIFPSHVPHLLFFPSLGLFFISLPSTFPPLNFVCLISSFSILQCRLPLLTTISFPSCRSFHVIISTLSSCPLIPANTFIFPLPISLHCPFSLLSPLLLLLQLLTLLCPLSLIL